MGMIAAKSAMPLSSQVVEYVPKLPGQNQGTLPKKVATFQYSLLKKIMYKTTSSQTNVEKTPPKFLGEQGEANFHQQEEANSPPGGGIIRHMLLTHF